MWYHYLYNLQLQNLPMDQKLRGEKKQPALGKWLGSYSSRETLNKLKELGI